jgi:hypothetical protein
MKQVNKVSTPRQPLSTLSKIIAGALLVDACAQFVGVVAEMLNEGVSAPHLIIGIILLVAAGLAFTGKRWTALLGAVVTVITTVIIVMQPTNSGVLIHPSTDTGHQQNKGGEPLMVNLPEEALFSPG